MMKFYLYREQTNWYMRIVRLMDGAIYDRIAGALSMGPGWAASAIALVWDANIGGYIVEVPQLPPEDYDLLFYESASPASSDVVKYGEYYSKV